MNLLIAADIFPPQSGGPATYVVSLANALKERGVDVRIVSLNSESERKSISCIMYHVSLKNKLLRYFQYTWLLFREARTSDVVYAMGPVNAGLPAFLVAWFHKKPFVVKVVGDYAWEQGVQRFRVKEGIDEFQKKQHGGMVRILQRIQSFVVRRATRVIVPCRYLKTLVEGWGGDVKHICVVYNAPNAKRSRFAPKPAGERWIVSAGRLVPWKGMSALIDAVVGLGDGFADTRLKIIGDGPERGKLETRVRNLQAENRVELLGALSHEQALSVIAAADVFILNSGYEGLSHVLLEAISMGVPILASRAGGNFEIVPEEQLFSVDARDEMREKILSAFLHPTLITLNDAFSAQKMMERIEEILQSVCVKS